MTQSIIPGCEANPDPTTVINVDPTKPMKVINMNETKNNVDNNDAFKHFLDTGSSVIETCRELLAENERLRKMVEQRNEIMNVLTRHFNDAELGDICSSLDGKLTLLGCFEDTIDKFKIEDVDHLHSSLQALEAYAKAADEKYTDYQTLKDFKGEMDAIHDEFDIPHDVEALRNDLQEAKDIREVIESNTDVDFSVDTWAKDLQEKLDDYNAYKQACDNHMVEPDELESMLDELDNYNGTCDEYGVRGSNDLDDALSEWEDGKKYKEGFDKLSEFVEKIKEATGNNGEDIPSTDVEYYG